MTKIRRKNSSEGKHLRQQANSYHHTQLRQASYQGNQKESLPTMAAPTTNLHFQTSPHKFSAFLLFTSSMLSLIPPSHGIHVSHAKQDNQGNRNRADENKLAALLEIHSLCKNPSLKSANKPPIRLDLHNQQSMPATCVSDLIAYQEPRTKACKEDLIVFNTFVETSRKNPETKQAILDARKNIKATIGHEAANIIANEEFTLEQMQKFLHYLDILESIDINLQTLNYSVALNAGNCGEHAAFNMFNIFKINKKFSTTTKMQLVEVSMDKKAINHVYLMINSDLNDVLITSDREKCDQILKSVQQGFICDSWNHGYVEEAAKNTNNFYRLGWDNLTIKTLTLDFDVCDLPQQAAQFIEQKATSLGLEHTVKNKMPSPQTYRNKMEL